MYTNIQLFSYYVFLSDVLSKKIFLMYCLFKHQYTKRVKVANVMLINYSGGKENEISQASGSGQDYDSTPAEGLQRRCLILLLATRLLSLIVQNPSAFAHRAGDPLSFSCSFSSFRPATSQPPPVEKFPLCIWLCPAFYISLKVKLTRTTMTERKLLKVKIVARYFRYSFEGNLKPG